MPRQERTVLIKKYGRRRDAADRAAFRLLLFFVRGNTAHNMCNLRRTILLAGTFSAIV
ncbi:hypothetical protein CLOHYLEM_05008 [[Clostridium] hylemonae DSM 15053]|uniref:Uncharacterized protein n=1 Tax=[Clostridium] hylemonae DSM 15053 TaxID=553973 RepID=C0BYW9_9FIRM|nr:hypothetical protein CLOHYLEM_05008 [[Clostridium] hylemonae DSM 15053]